LTDSASPSPSDLIRTLLGRCAFPAAGTAVTCAVSGGADSMALLILACAAGCDVTAVHVDHGLRPGSAAEADVVAAAAVRFGARFRALAVSVASGPNLEARARDARRAVLPADVLTGHTADDQAETVLINLLRGAGTAGLAGMRAAGHPILALRRSETVALCVAHDLTVVHDPTNADPRFVRNRIRHEVLPLLAEVAQRDVALMLARQARVLRDDSDLLDELAASLDPTDARALTRAPRALARRAIRRWLANPMPPSANEVDRVLAVAAGHITACELEGGRRVARTAMVLRLEPVSGAC
jgi:tRNA(Ile)-lysidine synthase